MSRTIIEKFESLGVFVALGAFFACIAICCGFLWNASESIHSYEWVSMGITKERPYEIEDLGGKWSYYCADYNKVYDDEMIVATDCVKSRYYCKFSKEAGKPVFDDCIVDYDKIYLFGPNVSVRRLVE